VHPVDYFGFATVHGRWHTIGFPLHQPCRHVRVVSPPIYTYPLAHCILHTLLSLPDEQPDVVVLAPVGAVRLPQLVTRRAAYLSSSADSTTDSSVSDSFRS